MKDYKNCRIHHEESTAESITAFIGLIGSIGGIYLVLLFVGTGGAL